MPYPIRIRIENLELRPELFDTDCARRLYEALPTPPLCLKK